MEKRAYTLVEVITILSVMAITSALAYNFIGRPYLDAALKQHAAQIARDMQAVAEAAESHYFETGSYPTSGTTSVAELAGDGYIKFEPAAPTDAIDPTDGAAPKMYQYVELDLDGNGNPERYVTIVPIKQEICEMYHKHSSGTSGSHDFVGAGNTATAFNPGLIMYCDYNSSKPAGRQYNPVYIMQWR